MIKLIIENTNRIRNRCISRAKVLDFVGILQEVQGVPIQKLRNYRNAFNYYCPLNFLVRYKFRADTSHEVSALFVIFAFASKLR